MNRFTMPTQAGSGDSQNLWYSVNVGNIHVATISTEHDYLPGSPQITWLAQDLANVDRSVTPWVIVMGHRPMYSSSKGHTLSVEDPGDAVDNHMRQSIEPLLAQYNVNMAMWGHVHAYERTCGIVGNFTCGASDSDGTVHIVRCVFALYSAPPRSLLPRCVPPGCWQCRQRVQS